MRERGNYDACLCRPNAEKRDRRTHVLSAHERGRGVARSDGVRAFRRVRTGNMPRVERIFCPSMNAGEGFGVREDDAWRKKPPPTPDPEPETPQPCYSVLQ
jgi:hypothetical protein